MFSRLCNAPQCRDRDRHRLRAHSNGYAFGVRPHSNPDAYGNGDTSGTPFGCQYNFYDGE